MDELKVGDIFSLPNAEGIPPSRKYELLSLTNGKGIARIVNGWMKGLPTGIDFSKELKVFIHPPKVTRIEIYG